MPKYRVVEQSFIDHKLRQPGEVIEYDGEVAANLEPIEDKKAKPEAKAPALA